MPPPETILDSLTKVANEWQVVAIVWHGVLAASLLALLLGWRPTTRLLGGLIALPIVSVSAISWASSNPFNAAAFGVLGALLLAIATWLPNRPIEFGSPLVVTSGSALILFGWTYPHFLRAKSWIDYASAAPFGLLPCPTLAMAIGATLMFALFRVRTWSALLIAAGILYGTIGVFRLGVILDGFLLAGVAALALALFREPLAVINFTAWRRAAAITVLMSVAGSASAQDAVARRGQAIEAWAGASGVVAAPSGTFTSSYSPPLLLGGDFSSHGEQVLSFRGGRAFGVDAGINYFVGRIGIQVLGDWTSQSVSGANQAYEYSLLYNTQVPSTGASTPVKIAQTVPWPDSSGTVRSLALAFNGVVRFGRPDRLNATISAGPAAQRIAGSVQPVAYTQFNLGGHSVLFQNDYQLELSLEPTIVWGFDVGGDLNVPLGPHAAVMIGYRHFGSRRSEVDVAVRSVLNPDQVTLSQPIGDITTRLAPAPSRIDLGSSRFIIAIKVR